MARDIPIPRPCVAVGFMVLSKMSNYYCERLYHRVLTNNLRL